MSEPITKEICEAKHETEAARHGEVMRALGHVEVKIDNALTILAGNGRPGLRATQSELEALKKVVANAELERQRAEARRDGWIMVFLRPALPLIYAAVGAALLFWIQSG